MLSKNKKCLHFLILLSISYLDATIANTDSETCAILYSLEEYNGNNVILSSGMRFADLTEEYFTDSISQWNATGSFNLTNGCRLIGCTDRYFEGNCQEFNQTSSKFSIGGISNFLSVKCSCKNDCKCSDIKLKRESCAYGFVSDGGCNSCDSSYVEIEKGLKSQLSEDTGRVIDILIKDGCSLTTYENEEFVEILMQGQGPSLIQNLTEPIGSYECSCNAVNIDSTTSSLPSPLSNHPDLLNVPNGLNEVSSLIRDNKGHSGLISALRSTISKRSSHKAYILVLGSTGSGKSSAINLLFDNPNVTLAGDIMSTTSDIHEFQVSIPLKELGINNSEISIIDTPGMGDTRGLQYDARFLATLDQYLSTHEELQNRIPNVVLIFHRFNDNRFSGEGSEFVKMLRGLQEFRSKITDETYSNVIFVLTHFCSTNLDVKKNPKQKIQQFRNVIEDYSLFPKPITIVLAENLGHDNELLSSNGAFKLPNGELYPTNLIEKMKMITSNGQDPIGKAIIQEAFVKPGKLLDENFNIISKTFKVSDDHSNFNASKSKYFNQLSKALIKLETTEVSQYISNAYQNMSQSLKQTFQTSSHYLQKALSIRDIRTLSDVPKTNLAIVDLFSNLKLNDGVIFLLKEGLSLTPPTFMKTLPVGTSYSALKDTVSTSIHLIQPGDPIPSVIGYTLPSSLSAITNLAPQTKDIFRIFNDKKEYLNTLKTELGLTTQINAESYTGQPPIGYNIVSSSHLTSNPNSTTKVKALREFRTFSLVLNDEYDLNPDFSQALRNLKPFNQSNYGNVENWKDFFRSYGTHVVQSVYGGGSIEIEATIKNSMISSISQSIYDLIDFADKTELSDRPKLNLSSVVSHTLNFKGGDPSYHTTDLVKMSPHDASNLLSHWKKSLNLRPEVLTTNLVIVPISQLAKKVGQNVSSEVDKVAAHNLMSTLTYVPSQWILNEVSECEKNKANIPVQAANQTELITKDIENMRKKVTEIRSKLMEDENKFKLELGKLNVENVNLIVKLMEKRAAAETRSQCESHKMTSYKY